MKPTNSRQYRWFVFAIAILALIAGFVLIISGFEPRGSLHVYSYYLCLSAASSTLGFCYFALSSFRKYFQETKLLSVRGLTFLTVISFISVAFLVWSAINSGPTNDFGLSLVSILAVCLVAVCEGLWLPVMRPKLRRRVNQKIFGWVIAVGIVVSSSSALSISLPNIDGNLIFWAGEFNSPALSFVIILITIWLRTEFKIADLSSILEENASSTEVTKLLLESGATDEDIESAKQDVVDRTIANQDAMNYLTDLRLSNPRDVIRSENAIRMQFGILNRNKVPLSTEFAQVVGKWTMLQDYAPGLTRLVSEEGKAAMETLERATSGQIKEYLKSKFPDCMVRDDVAALLAKEPKISPHLETLLTMRNPQSAGAETAIDTRNP
jgi:uncharacterized protein YjeT (DUF2065 family)